MKKLGPDDLKGIANEIYQKVMECQWVTATEVQKNIDSFVSHVQTDENHPDREILVILEGFKVDDFVEQEK